MIDPDLKAKLIEHLNKPDVEIVEFSLDVGNSNPPYISFTMRTFSADAQQRILLENVLEVLKRYQRGL
jgi:hypothetical protein